MFISEIFYSIQGEGELIGMPSVFVRTSGCNLRCSWCDTKYASWNPEGYDMSVDEIAADVLDFDCEHVVLTGGEPMIAKGIRDLAAKLRLAGMHVTIETAATIYPNGICCDLASLSPKLSNSRPDTNWWKRHEQTRLQPSVIDVWISQYNYQIKFVVSAMDDIEEIDDLLSKIKHVSPNKIMLMPEGVDVGTIRGRDETLVELCKRRKFRYCNRLQIELFGNTRGT